MTATPTLKLTAVIVPLGIDTLAVALALRVAGVTPRRRLRIALLFEGFEAVMPLIGVALGAPLGRSIDAAARLRRRRAAYRLASRETMPRVSG